MSTEVSPMLTMPVFRDSPEASVTRAARDAAVIECQENPQLNTQPDLWLSAPTELGRIYLGVFKTNEIDNSLPTDGMILFVLAMKKFEAAIQLVEEWLGVRLDLSPGNTPNDQQIQMELTAKENTSIRGLLSLPVNSLSAIPQPPEYVSDSYAIKWKSLPLELLLSCVEISSSQLEKIEPGGLYLLTESFRPDWFCEVNIQNTNTLKYKGKIDQADKLLILHQPENQDESLTADLSIVQDSDLNEISVQLESPVYVSANRLISWCEDKSIDLEGLLFSSKVFLLRENNRIAVGMMIPVLQGYAVQIESLI